MTTPLDLTSAEWECLEGIVRRFLVDARPDQYDDYAERRLLCERVLGHQIAAKIAGPVKA